MLVKFLIAEPADSAGSGLLVRYLNDRPRVTVLGEQFALTDPRFADAHDWLAEIQKIFDVPKRGRRAHGCILKPDDPSALGWILLRRQISLAVPDLRVVLLRRGFLEQYIEPLLASAERPISVDTNRMLEVFSTWADALARLRQLFASHSCLRLAHEDLVDRPREAMDLVGEFLGLPPLREFEVRPASRPSVAEILRDIANIGEVQSKLACSRWAAYVH